MAIRPRGKINGKGEGMSDKTKVCEQCNRAMSEAEGLIHADNWPEHSVVSVNEEPISN